MSSYRVHNHTVIDADDWPRPGDVLDLPGTGLFEFIDPSPGYLCAIGDMIDTVPDTATVWQLAAYREDLRYPLPLGRDNNPAFVRSER